MFPELYLLLVLAVVVALAALAALSALSTHARICARTRDGYDGGSRTSNVMYHGSKYPLGGVARAGDKQPHEMLQPRPSRVIGGESAVFATNARWLALAFIPNATDDNIEIGIVGDNGKAIPHLIESRPGAFELLKVPGYIYTVSARGFKADPRLGMRRYEFVRKSPTKVISVEKIASVLDELRKCDVLLVPYRDRAAFIAKYDIPV